MISVVVAMGFAEADRKGDLHGVVRPRGTTGTLYISISTKTITYTASNTTHDHTP